MMHSNRLFITIAALVLALFLALGNTIAAAQQPMTFNSRIVIHVPSRTLLLYYGDVVVKTYPVGVGRADFPTPEGQFRVINKVVDPGWENPFKGSGRKNRVKPGKDSPLGTRWIGFLEANGGEYGIHGTNAPYSVGKFSSHGCVRMYIQDAEALFNQVTLGTPVEVNYDLAWFDMEGDQIKLTLYPDWFNQGQPSLSDLRLSLQKRFPNAEISEEQLARVLETVHSTPMAVGKLLPEDDPDGSVLTFKLRINN